MRRERAAALPRFHVARRSYAEFNADNLPNRRNFDLASPCGKQQELTVSADVGSFTWKSGERSRRLSRSLAATAEQLVRSCSMVAISGDDDFSHAPALGENYANNFLNRGLKAARIRSACASRGGPLGSPEVRKQLAIFKT
jgi:hypothetical protein